MTLTSSHFYCFCWSARSKVRATRGVVGVGVVGGLMRHCLLLLLLFLSGFLFCDEDKKVSRGALSAVSSYFTLETGIKEVVLLSEITYNDGPSRGYCTYSAADSKSVSGTYSWWVVW